MSIRRIHVFMILNIVLSLYLITSCDTKERPPNVILIMADDLGYECLGCNGGESYRTPNLDRLAQNGIRYTNCFSQPLCTPSRVQIMTGKYNHRNYEDFGILRPGERTFGHVFQEHGYVTAVVGKWQLFGSKTDSIVFGQGTFPTDAGFDEYCLWQIDQVGSRYADPLIHWNDTSAQVFEGLYGPDVFFSYIRTFLADQKEQSFLLYYPMALPHSPHMPTPGTAAWDTARNSTGGRYFGDMVAYMDKIVGQIENELKQLGLWENTYILFTGDNGTNRQIQSRFQGTLIPGQKGIPSYYGTHVPLIVSGGPVESKSVVADDLIDFTDFFPTLCGLAGIELNQWVGDGQRFDMTFSGGKGSRDWIYSWYYSGKKHLPTAEFAQNSQFKLYEDGRLFNIREDPGEQQPLDTNGFSSHDSDQAGLLMSVLENFRSDSL